MCVGKVILEKHGTTLVAILCKQYVTDLAKWECLQLLSLPMNDFDANDGIIINTPNIQFNTALTSRGYSQGLIFHDMQESIKNSFNIVLSNDADNNLPRVVRFEILLEPHSIPPFS